LFEDAGSDDSQRGSHRSAFEYLLLLCGICLFCNPVAWASPTQIQFNIPAGDFEEAIVAFGAEAKVLVSYGSMSGSFKGGRTRAVIGTLEPRAALAILLEGTGVVAEWESERSVWLRRVDSEASTKARVIGADDLGHINADLPGPGSAQLVPQFSLPMDQVMITGTLIRGVSDMEAPIVKVTQKDLSFAPFPTVQDALYQLPIVSLDGPRSDLGTYNNFNYGSAINLRGLGLGATLVLVNGRRQPLSGLNSDFVDVSNIPAAAVDRIEILPQGASATYGSDAIAGVVNIILKEHFEGAQTQVHYGGTPGGQNNLVVSQLLGTHWSSGNVMFVYQYSDGTALPASARGYAANENKTPYGGGDYRSFYADPGNIVDPNTLLPVSGGTGGVVRYENGLANLDLFPEAVQHSFYGTGKEELGTVELFAEGRYTQRSTFEAFFPQIATIPLGPDNPFNPNPGNTTLVDYSFSKVFGTTIFSDETQNYVGTLGARIQFGKDWQANLSETYGQERLYSHEYNVANEQALETAAASSDSTKAFNPFGTTNPAVLASIWGNYPTHATSGIESTSLIADGPLFDLWGGPLRMAAGLEHREESLNHSEGTSAVAGETPIDGRYDRHVGSAFAELSLPLVGDPANQHAVPRLELTLAGRYDHYSGVGGTTNPELGVHWVPTDSLKLRGSWGKSYRAPKLDDLYDASNNESGLALIPDPRSPTGRSLVLAMQGDNPNLKPELAKTWTAGFDLVPSFAPKLVLSLTYYSIDYRDQITTADPADPVTILTQENEWAAVITRNPTAAQIAAVCGRSDYYGSVATCLTSTPAAIIDLRVANLASTQTNGLDLNVNQKLTVDAGYFDFGFVGNYVFHFDQAVSNTSSGTDILNTFANPLKFRFRTTAAWDRHLPEESGLGASLAVNFTNAYENPGSTLLPGIRSLTTLDLQLRYHTAENSGWLGGVDIALNAVNVFNASPPFADTPYGFDRANAQPLGRVLGLSVTKKW
jgi:iron complex outermembrane recepter protein